jgi:glycosyltransferase involved in cell wall biosynthesis
MSELLLHPENLLRVPVRGSQMVENLERRVQELRDQVSTLPVDRSLGISILIRTKNDAGEIGQLLDDIRANQEYFAGPIQIILVDTESSDDTLKIAKRYDKFFEVTVVPIKQAEFDYPKSLNRGFEAAKHGLVFTLVGHSALTNKLTLAAARLYAGRSDYVGGFCYTMPNSNATFMERLAYGFGRPAGMLKTAASPLTKEIMGMMGANCSVVRREAWKKLGGYNLYYAAGGEDADFGRRAMAAGYKVVIDPVLTVYHSHGLGFIGNARQMMYWWKLGKPRGFDASRLEKFRPDLASKRRV